MTTNLSLPQGALYEQKEVNINFPSTWQVETCESPADKMEPVTDGIIKSVFANPVGTKNIKELAEGKKEVAIIFDDITRGTRVSQLIPYILDELASAGIKDKQIRFICAVGCHGAHTLLDFTNKLGKKIVSRYPVYNHNPYENCEHVGKTSRGTVVSINAELMRCDLKIAIGSITPHPLVGFGGGGKIIAPGVAFIDTIKQYHDLALKALKKSVKEDRCDNPFQEIKDEMGEISRLAGLDIIVNAMVNSRCHTVDLVIGDPVEAYEVGLKKAKQVYGTKLRPEADIVVVNANFKVNESFITIRFGSASLKPGGDIIVIAHAPMGQAVHYLLGRFGNYMGGQMWNPNRSVIVGSKVGRIIIFNPYRNYVDEDWFGGFDRACWASSWEQVMKIISPGSGEGTRVNVFPDATIQYHLAE